MSDERMQVVHAWFRKAENDLVNAEHTLTMASPPCDTVCFHAQQCAEKYLKGFLTLHRIEFPRTHDLEDLVSLCTTVAPALAAALDGIEILSSYGVEMRYPSEVYFDVPRKDAEEALALAIRVKTAILRQMENPI